VSYRRKELTGTARVYENIIGYIAYTYTHMHTHLPHIEDEIICMEVCKPMHWRLCCETTHALATLSPPVAIQPSSPILMFQLGTGPCTTLWCSAWTSNNIPASL